MLYVKSEILFTKIDIISLRELLIRTKKDNITKKN